MFQSTHPLRGATNTPLSKFVFFSVSIHAPLARCDSLHLLMLFLVLSFNPRTPCEVRQITFNTHFVNVLFQSTHPLRGATHNKGFKVASDGFQSTHPLRGATNRGKNKDYKDWVSIHAPLARCDLALPPQYISHIVSIHAPLARCDVGLGAAASAYARFQSTHPLRGATITARFTMWSLKGFNPRTPCEVRPPFVFILRQIKLFQSTHPLRGATFNRL